MTLEQEHRQRVFKNWVLGKIAEPKRDEVTRECRRLNTEQIYDL
jgi:hypothetical protein